MMTPDEAEAHAKSAKRQFDALGIYNDIEPEEYRDLAAEHQALMNYPATRGDIEELRNEVRELKRLIQSLQPVYNFQVTGAQVADAYSRASYKVTKALNSV